MGLFALPLGKTWQENIAEAEANLRLLREEGMTERDAHLIHAAIHCLETAQRKIRDAATSPNAPDA
jgi:hypothetical protein